MTPEPAQPLAKRAEWGIFDSSPTSQLICGYVQRIHAEVCGSSLDPFCCSSCMACGEELAAVLPAHEVMVRASVAGEMLRAAAGREEYANGAPEGAREHLLVQVDTFKTAAKIAEGDPHVMCGVMPTRMWTEAEERAARGET